MKRLLAMVAASAIVASWNEVQADVRVTESTETGVRYETLLPGMWTEVPPAAGTQRTYTRSFGTEKQVTCTFRSNDPAFLRNLYSNRDWPKVFTREITDKLKNDPDVILSAIKRSRPAFTLEDHFATSDERTAKLTLIYSYDELAVVQGRNLRLRVLGYETQTYVVGAMIQVTCATPFANYTAETGKEFRRIRDSISARTK